MKLYLNSLLLFITLCIISCQNNPHQDSSGITKETSGSHTEDISEDHPGLKTYRTYCQVCHRADGSGISNMYPPLINTEWVIGDKERLVRIILEGMKGPIEINGVEYNNIMPPQKLNYIRTNFDNNAALISTGEVEEIRGRINQQ